MTIRKIGNPCTWLLFVGVAFGQNGATSLQSLIAEAQQNNPSIKAS
jgi:hypothetical protein